MTRSLLRTYFNGLPIEDLYVKGLQQIWSGGLGYVGKAAGQLKNQNDPRVFFIGGEGQVWIPGLIANDIRRISILPFLQPNTPFRKI